MEERIKFFVNTWIFGKIALEEIIERVASLEYDGIELVGEPKIYKAKEVNSLVKGERMSVISICGMFPGPEKNDLRALSHFDKRERQKAIDYVKTCIDLALEVEAHSVLVAPSLVGRPEYFCSKEEDMKWAIDSLQRVGKYAEDEKMVLTIEPINRYEVGLVNSIEDALKMAKEVNNSFVRIMGDTFHMQMEEGDGIPNAIRRAGGEWLRHLHAADNTREAPGKGTMNWREIIRALYDIGYQGAISLEPLPKGASPYEAREGIISKEKLDSDLKYALTYLKREQEFVMGYICAEGKTK